MKFDHVGIVVKSIEEARAIFESDLPGFSPSKIYIDKEIDVKKTKPLHKESKY